MNEKGEEKEEEEEQSVVEDGGGDEKEEEEEEEKELPGQAFFSVLGKTPVTHHGQLANFGFQLNFGRTYDANLMLPPPDNPTLCNYPQSLLNTNNNNNNKSHDDTIHNSTTRPPETYSTPSPTPPAGVLPRSQRPIALFVSRGGCSFDRKARVAIAMQQNVSSLLKYIVVYNNNPDDPRELLIMSTSAKGEPLEQLEAISFLFVSYLSGNSILSRIESENTNHVERDKNPNNNDPDNVRKFHSPYFGFHQTSNTWYLPVLIDAFPSDVSSGADGYGGSNSRAQKARATFHWLRFVLFSLLIVSPCVRAAYLWYSAGGRILLRRDDTTGRPAGLLYVRPMPFWFASPTGMGEGDRGRDGVTDCLTEEQVDALPEIVYRIASNTQDKEEDKEDNEKENNDDQNEDAAAVAANPITDGDHENTSVSTPLLTVSEPLSPTTKPTTTTTAAPTTISDDILGSEEHQNVDDDDDDDDTDERQTETTANPETSSVPVSSDEEQPTNMAHTTKGTTVEEEKDLVTLSGNDVLNDGSTTIATLSPLLNKTLFDEEQQSILNPYPTTTMSASTPNTESIPGPSAVDSDPNTRTITSRGDMTRSSGGDGDGDGSGSESRSRILTSCTMCSICLDEFEDEERIRLLPKCRHGFHMECIKPWLTERQGCCPLCKTQVLGAIDGGDQDTTNVSSSSLSSSTSSPSENEQVDDPNVQQQQTILQPQPQQPSMTTSNDSPA